MLENLSIDNKILIILLTMFIASRIFAHYYNNFMKKIDPLHRDL